MNTLVMDRTANAIDLVVSVGIKAGGIVVALVLLSVVYNSLVKGKKNNKVKYIEER